MSRPLVRTVHVSLAASEREKEVWLASAESEGRTLCGWARERLNRAAARPDRDLSPQVEIALRFHLETDDPDFCTEALDDNGTIRLCFQSIGDARFINIEEILGWELGDRQDDDAPVVGRWRELFVRLAMMCARWEGRELQRMETL